MRAHASPVPPDPTEVVRLLADPDRVRAFAAVALGARTLSDVARAAGLDQRDATKAVGRLVAGGLVVQDAAGYAIASEALREAALEAAEPDDPEEHAGRPAEQAAVLRAFVRRGRLVSIPAVHSKRLVILDFLAQAFEPGRHYSERDVNEVLLAYHDDVAALRRYLVDEGFLSREHGYYWRTGGSFMVDEA